MILTEELVNEIVEKVLKEINKTDIEKNLIISDNNQIESNEILYLDYDTNTKYNKYIIKDLSLKECACIIHNIRYNQKVNFILDNYKLLKMSVLKFNKDENDMASVYYEMLLQMGFDFIEDYLQENNNINKNIVEEKEFIFNNKKLINERDLIDLRLIEDSTIIISNKAIVTPLAKDYLRKNKVKIIKEAKL